MEQIFNFTDQRRTRRDRRLLSAESRPDNNRSNSSSRLESMITVVALTQFAFLTLGIVSLKILIHSVSSVPPSIRRLDVISLWLFSVPVIWSAYATITVRMDKRPVSAVVAQTIGIVLAVLSSLFLAAVVFYLPTKL